MIAVPACRLVRVLVSVLSTHSTAGRAYLIDPLFRDAVPQSDEQVAWLNLQVGSADVMSVRSGIKAKPC